MRRQGRKRVWIIIVLLIVLIGGFFVWRLLPNVLPRRAVEHTGIAPAAADLRGVFAGAAENELWSAAGGATRDELAGALTAMVDDAVAGGFNTLLFDGYVDGALYESAWATPDARLTAENGKLKHDPLEMLVNIAHARDVAVLATLSPQDGVDAEHAFTDVLTELITYYAVDGIVVRSAEAFELPAWIALVREHNDTLRVGVADSADALAGVNADYLFHPLDVSTLGVGDDYAQALADAREAVGDRLVPVYTSVLLEQPGAVSLAFLYNRELGQTGWACSDLVMFRELPQESRDELTRQRQAPHDVYLPPDNEFPRQLTVARPENSDNKSTYSGSTYYLMGTSDPDSPVTVNGEEITQRAPSGAFGLLVDLKYGKNTFVFEQNGESITAVVTRPQSTGTGKITQITQSSMFPQSSDIAYAGKEYRFKCTAPGGSTVVASVLGQSVTLSPAASASAGTPVTYTGRVTIPVGAAGADEVKNVGKTKYTMTYNGATKSFESDGVLYVVGTNAKAAVRSTEYLASVYNEANSNSGYYSQFNPGVCDYVVSSTDSYFELAFGGFIQKSNVEILTQGFEALGGTPTQTTLTVGARADTIRLHGVDGLPHRIYLEGETLVWELYNLDTMGDIDCTDSALLDKVTVGRSGEHVRLTMYFTDFSLLWGYDIDHDGGDTILYLKHSLRLSDDPLQPLAGLSFVIDPGHGANDSGALTFTGNGAPTEKSLNLDVSLALADILRSWGADVTMTRDDDSRIIIAERYPLSRSLKPDMFLSIHHNSVSESTDANASAGTEVYYHNDLSASLANNIAAHISEYVDRRNRGTFQRNFLVTRLFYAPAVLVEVGFLPNPFEAEQVIDSMMMHKTARAIADAIIETLPR